MRKKTSTTRAPARERYFKSFEELVVMIPTAVFMQAVNKSSMSTDEKRELCRQFMKMKK